MVNRLIRRFPRLVFAAFVITLAACTNSVPGAGGNNGGDDGGNVNGQDIPATTMSYVVLSWNDLGMHCLNPTYDQAVILPPYNTVWAQVIRRGEPPQIVTSGITVEYSIVGNTYSYGKRSYGQFWDNCLQLFGVSLAHDRGLNLEDPNIHNGLSGTMVLKGNHFQVNGIPVTPVDDSLTWNPLQVGQIVVKDANGTELVRTQTTVPTSDEINCAKCHGSDPLLDVLQKHDQEEGTSLVANRPVLCASCHGSPALGQTGPGSSGHFLSGAIHSFHASKGAACYDCHPGATTKCNRSAAHTASDGNCTTCHGDLNQVGGSVQSGARTPWVDEPKCVTCHSGIAEVDTGTTLYRNATGHGGMACPSCHQSPHAMIPSQKDIDNYQAKQYQNAAKVIGVCSVCHDNTKGEGISEFGEAHGGGRPTACSVCHTSARSTDASRWPHQFQWKQR